MPTSLSLAGIVAAVMSSLIATHGAPSVSVAVVRHDRIVFDSTMGLSNIATGERASPQTLYRIGSITKVFTAISVMQLVEQGRLSLHESLATFEPTFPNAAKITIRDLLMHRSGIPDYLDAAISSGQVMRPTAPGEIVELVSRLKPQSQPGTAYSYSNANYVLLGVIVQRVSGLSLAAYYARYIFAPAGMRATYAGKAPQSREVATGYNLERGTMPQNPGDITWYFGCGDIYSTASDLAHFDIALMEGRLVRASTLRAMAAAAMPTGQAGQDYGLGLMTFPFGQALIEGHHGGLPGFESDDEMIVRDGFAVIALGNDYHFPTRAILDATLRDLYPIDFAAVVAAQRAATARERTNAASVTARFTAFFEDILHGRVPTENLDAAMESALTPAAVARMAHAYAQYGGFKQLDFTGQDTAGPYTRYHYNAVFTHASEPETFVLDQNGAIAGFFS